LTFIRALALTSAPNFSYICLDDDHTDIQSVKQLRRAVTSVSLPTRRLGLEDHNTSMPRGDCECRFHSCTFQGYLPVLRLVGGRRCVCIRENKKQQFVSGDTRQRLGPLGAGSLDMAAPLEHAWAWGTNGSLLGTFIQKFPGSSDLVPHVEYLARSRATPPGVGTLR
jgi:hypothetical protein